MRKTYEEPPYIITPTLTLHSDELYTYGRIDWIHDTRKSNNNSLKNLENNRHKNKLSNKSKLKIERSIKLLMYHAHEKIAYNYKTRSKFRFKINFITLTLPFEQLESDIDFKKHYLNQFLIEAKKKWKMLNYIWKAEKQSNGNIHIHIVSDVFIPWLELRNTWNRILNKSTYINQFEKKWSHRNPNSTDIHSVKENKKILEYMEKYIKKDLKGQTIEGNLWRCSTTLSNLKGASSEITKEINDELERLKTEKNVKRIDGDYFSGFYFDNSLINKKRYPALYSLWISYLDNVFRNKQHRIENFGV
jgi:hypothetical protein